MSIITIALATRTVWRRRPALIIEEEPAPAFTPTDFIAGALRGSHRTLLQAVEVLSQEGLEWRPYPKAASAGFILWHVARVLDALVHQQLLDQPELWVTQGWAQQFDLPPDETGQEYTGEQFAAFRVPPKADLLGYLDATYDAALRSIEALGPERLDVETEEGLQPMRYLVLLVNHANMHAGAIGYIRELLNASPEVPPGP